MFQVSGLTDVIAMAPIKISHDYPYTAIQADGFYDITAIYSGQGYVQALENDGTAWLYGTNPATGNPF